MKRSETALVLAKIAAIDNRRLDPIGPNTDLNDPLATPILSGWFELIGDLSAVDCLEAVRRFRLRSREWIQPFDVVEGVKAIRAARLEVGPPMGELMKDVDPDMPGAEYARIYRERIQMVADGRTTQLRAIQGGVA